MFKKSKEETPESSKSTVSEKLKDPVSSNADPRDQPSNLGTPVSNTAHTKEQEVETKEIEEGETLPTPPSPAIRYAPSGDSDAEKRETAEFRAVTPPGGVVGEGAAMPFFPREMVLVGSKERVLAGLDGAGRSNVKGDEGSRFKMGFELAKLTTKDQVLSDSQRLRLRIKWSDKGAPNVNAEIEEVRLPAGVLSVEALEAAEAEAASA